MVLHNDKREYRRMEMVSQMRFRPQAGDEFYPGQCKNLSTGGIAFHCDQRIDAGSLVEIDITLEKAIVPPLHATIEVLRAVRLPEGYEIAGKFTEMK